MNNPTHIAIAFTINDAYAQHCCVAMASALKNNPDTTIDIYILTDYFSESNRRKFDHVAACHTDAHVHFVMVDHQKFTSLRINIEHITQHTYYRLLLPELLPDVKKVLYLDADLVVDGSLKPLWDFPLGDDLCAGVRDLWIDKSNYKPIIGIPFDQLYVNAGVLLMNLEQMRKEHTSEQFMQIANKESQIIDFQDQDIINLALQGRIRELPRQFNRMVTHANDEATPVIIHYNGATKPWSKNQRCHNPLAGRYLKYLMATPYRNYIFSFIQHRLIRGIKKIIGIEVYPQRIRIGLVIDEYFGACGTAFGGYGFLARNYAARYLGGTKNMQVDVLLSNSSRRRMAWWPLTETVDKRKVITPPGRFFVKQWLRRQKYDLYLTIELTHDLLRYERKKTPIIHWIQDPRPWGEWREIQTVKLFPETCYWKSGLYDFVHARNKKGRITFVSQAYCLNDKAKELYRLPLDTPIRYMPNPIDIDYTFGPKTHPKKNHILFIGRIESVKRGWLFCEIAKRMPHYEFYMLGQTFREKGENERVMSQYQHGIPNLHFVGHVEGEEKMQYIRDAKILVNTSIHEALPITFLEALAYGTLLVSCRNPEHLTERFGRYVGTVLGDGFEKVPLFVDAIEDLMTHEDERIRRSCEAVEYIREVHPPYKFQKEMRALIRELVHK